MRRLFITLFLFAWFFATAPAQAASCQCRILGEVLESPECIAVQAQDCKELEQTGMQRTCRFYPSSDTCGGTAASELQFGNEEIYVPPKEPRLQIPIPTVKFTPSTIEESGGKRFYLINTLADYVSGVYTYLLSIAGILAGIMITVGGFQWLIAAGDAGKIKAAKEKIVNALVGILIAAGSYVLLSAINPDLVAFKSLRIEAVPREYAPDIVMGGAEGKPMVIPDSFEPLNVADYITANITDGTAAAMQTDAAESFLKAAEEFSRNTDSAVSDKKILITSAFRTYEKQCDLYKRNCGVADCSKKASGACKPATCFPGPDPKKTFCPHTSGIAVDLWCEGDGTAKCAKGGNFGVLDEEKCPCQKILTDTMRRNGFCRLSGEIWHFEYKSPMSNGCQ